MPSPCGSGYCRFSAFMSSGFAYYSAYELQRAIPSARGLYASASHLTLAPLGGTGMLTRLPSPTPFGLGLGPD